MGRSEKEFARLLTEGIHRIRVCESNKLISVIQDELGYAIERNTGGSAIEYWRKGHIPSENSDVEQLAREIIRRSNLGREWLEEFLNRAGYPDHLSLCNELFPPPPPSHIPSKTYRKLVGRDVLVDEAMAALLDPSGRWIVAIDGMGGIGKTALAREIADRCWKEDHFDAVVWMSAARSEPTPAAHREISMLNFEAVLDTIARELEEPGISKLKTKREKESRVRELLREQQALVVLDNLETAEEPQNRIARQLRPLLGPSKALLTSRHRFKGDIYSIHLTGLDEDPALKFIHQEAEAKRISRIEMAEQNELEQIVESTGGSPQAMKLVVGQLGHLPLEVVLKHLQEVRPLESEIDEDEYLHFYKLIYFPSWELLSDIGQKLLIAMAQFVPGWGGTPEAIKAVSGLADDELPGHIHELWRLSFLEVEETSNLGLKQIRYYLHTLTQYFVLSDIVQELDEFPNTAHNDSNPSIGM